MDIKINRENKVPLYKQIVSQVTDKIRTGELEIRSSLPSVCTLAEKVEINPITVSRAYEQLEADGFIETIPGKGSYVIWKHETDDVGSDAWHAFWSYSRKDDSLSHGKISELADDIRDEYELQTGKTLHIFKDIEGIRWGENWREVVDRNLLTTVFFIPILTPNYFASSACLHEIKTVLRQLDNCGLKNLLFPIKYINIDLFLNESPDDELVRLIKDTQHNDWSQLRLRDRFSEEYRMGVNRVVDELIKRDQDIIESCCTDLSLDDPVQEISRNEEDRGFLEDLADMESAFDELVALSLDLNSTIATIGSVAEKGAGSIALSDSRNKGFAGRLTVTRQIAKELDPLSWQLQNQCTTFTSLIVKVDRGISALISMITEEAKNRPADKKLFEEGGLFHQIRSLEQNSAAAFEGVSGLQDALILPEKASRDLRTPIKKIRIALADFNSNKSTFSNWAKQVDSAERILTIVEP